jgi:aldehyde:ferredoxin oxidoreductase
MMRIFNLREGFGQEDDKLPDRFFSSPETGPLKDLSVDPKALRECQEIYYQMRGWDRNGVPTLGYLTALDLDWTRRYLQGHK